MSEVGPVVADSGPVIALAVVGKLDLLKQLYAKIVAPEAVFEEVSAAGAGRPGASELLRAAWIERVVVNPPPDPLLAEELGRGEAEAITLAIRLRARLLLVDDRRARRVAEVAYGIRVKGVAGILLQAKRCRAIPAVRPILDEMRTHGYFLSQRVLDGACHQAGED